MFPLTLLGNPASSVREVKVRHIVFDHEIPARRCLHFRKQIQQTITSLLKNTFSTSGGYFRVQAQGTYLNYTALLGDVPPVFIIHDTNVSDDEIASDLKNHQNISILEASEERVNTFHCTILLPDSGPKIRGKGPEPGDSQVVSCKVSIIRLFSVRLYSIMRVRLPEHDLECRWRCCGCR